MGEAEDVVIDLTDGISILSYLFLGGTEPTCLESAEMISPPRLRAT